jgi:hypothetical protein
VVAAQLTPADQSSAARQEICLDGLALLHGLASRSDVLLFPVACISNEATNAQRALCRQTGKGYIPLLSASITSMLAALQAPEIAALAEGAD